MSRASIMGGPSFLEDRGIVRSNIEIGVGFRAVGTDDAPLSLPPLEVTSSMPLRMERVFAQSDNKMDILRQHFRSLSYLSLTLWCIAPHSGWLGGCAPLHRRRSERKDIVGVAGSDNAAEDSNVERYEMCVSEEGQAEPQPSSWVTSRIRPVFP